MCTEAGAPATESKLLPATGSPNSTLARGVKDFARLAEPGARDDPCRLLSVNRLWEIRRILKGL